jgi:iron complex outermembrane receptor protein
MASDSQASWVIAAMLLGTGAAWPAHAVDGPDDPGAGVVIEEILVTAQRRSQSVQDVPASLTALSGATLQERSVSGPEGLAAQVPGLQFAEYANTTMFAIRGISLDVLTGAGEPSVATHVDGVYLARPTVPLIDLDDVDRVEILRGPQGTLYGRNSTGGTINFISARPTPELSGGSKAGFGSFGRFVAGGYVSIPLAERGSGIRLAASYDNHDGQADNLVTGDPTDGRERTYQHLSLALLPGDNLSVDLGLFYIDEELDGPVQYAIQQRPFYEFVFPTETVNYTERPWKVYNDFRPKTDRSLLLGTANIAFDLGGDVTLRSITGYADNEFGQTFDADATDLDYMELGDDVTGPRRIDSKWFSQEFNISGTVGALDFVTGLYYFTEQFKPLVAFGFPLGIPGALPPGTEFYGEADEDTDSYAGFVDLTYALTERLTGIAGVRVSYDEKRNIQSFGASLPGFPLGTGPGMACIDQVNEENWNSVTPRLGAQYDASDDTMLYAQYQRGNKAGQFNITVCGNEVSPENVDAYEVGLKSRLFDQQVTLNFALFQSDYEDMHVIRSFVTNNVATAILDNAATARVRGAEVEALATTVVPDVAINLGVTYLDSRYEDYVAGPGLDYTGNELNRAPKWTVKSGAEWRIQLGGLLSEVMLRGEANYTDRMFFAPSNQREQSSDPATVFNAYLTLASDPWGLTLKVYGTNLTDEEVLVGALDAAASQAILGYWNSRRSWGVELSKAF